MDAAIQELIALALRVAQQQRGEDHLQPADVIRGKWLHELQEFEEALGLKSRLDMLSEVADLVYYFCQEYAHDQDRQDLDASVTYISNRANITPEQAYTVALAKYRLRASAPGMKDFERENEAIAQALR